MFHSWKGKGSFTVWLQKTHVRVRPVRCKSHSFVCLFLWARVPQRRKPQRADAKSVLSCRRLHCATSYLFSTRSPSVHAMQKTGASRTSPKKLALKCHIGPSEKENTDSIEWQSCFYIFNISTAAQYKNIYDANWGAIKRSLDVCMVITIKYHANC